MLVSLLAIGIGALVAPLLIRWLGRRAFLFLALLPLGVFAYTVTLIPHVIDGGIAAEALPWIPTLGISLSFRIDTLALVLALIVTGIGALVLAYCAFYFSNSEVGLGRFAGLLLAFAGVMYGLVTADDVLIMFVFWEMTSVLSYLLIGHYTGRKESRGAALQALTVTTFGGLAMLVGIVIVVVATGSTSLAHIVTHPVTGALGETAIALILVGALSKSALVPFHFWLPAAMAAPTPVSAYLHAAAMVKAGIYLVARFAPGYADHAIWLPIVVLIGGFTMLVGGWRAMRQYDLKLLLAYGTVSQLGFLVLVFGFGTPETALAGMALLVAHALYKATLFLVVGIVDHAAGTRDWRKLTGLGRRMPVLATVSAIAIGSMIGLPPLLGFVAKEAVFGSLIDATALHSDGGWAWSALVIVTVGSILTVAYSLRFFWGTFFSRPSVEPLELHHIGAAIVAPPALLSLATVGGGLGVHWLDTLFSGYSATIAGSSDYHLALWHGFEPALAISTAVILIGFALAARRRAVARAQDRIPNLIDASRTYMQSMRALNRISAALTGAIQRGGLPSYIAIMFVTFIGGLGFAALTNTVWPDTIRLADYAAQPFIAAVIIIAAIITTLTRRRIAAVLLVGVTGYGLTLLFAMGGAPDLALTQGLVETITIVVFVLVLRHLPTKVAAHKVVVPRLIRAIIGIAAGTVMAVIAVIALGARTATSISEQLPELAKQAHGANVVNVMLVDIRAWDTMGEISVLVAVATGVASLIFITGRTGTAPRLAGGRERRRRGNIGRPILDAPAGSSTTTQPIQLPYAATDDETTRSRRAWLLAGRTLSPEHRSLLLEVMVRLLFHPAIIVSLFLLFAGHNQPGGGFAGGLVAGLALVARYLAGGRYELGEAAPIDAGKVLGAGLLLTIGTALASIPFGLAPLTSSWFETEIPVLGTISVGTSTVFDIGVYLVVIGLVLDILRSLGAEVDKQHENDDEAVMSS